MSTEAPISAEDKARYDTAKKELIQALTKKRTVDKQLAQLEVQIYNFENSYLTDTNAHSGGNIIQGFDGYLKNQSVTRRRFEPQEHDRIFSNSSLTYKKSMELLGEGEEPTMDDSNATANKTQSSGLTTVVLPPASRTQELTAAQQKKMRDKEYQRRKRASLRNAMQAEEESNGGDGQSHRRPTKRARGEE